MNRSISTSVSIDTSIRYSSSNDEKLKELYNSQEIIKFQGLRLSLVDAYKQYGGPKREPLAILKANLPRHFLNFTTNKTTLEHIHKGLVQWYIDMGKELRPDEKAELNNDLENLLQAISDDRETVADIKRVFSKVCGNELTFKFLVDPQRNFRGATFREMREQIAEYLGCDPGIISFVYCGKTPGDEEPVPGNGLVAHVSLRHKRSETGQSAGCLGHFHR